MFLYFIFYYFHEHHRLDLELYEFDTYLNIIMLQFIAVIIVYLKYLNIGTYIIQHQFIIMNIQ